MFFFYFSADDVSPIGAAVRRVRADKGLTQQELAERAGLHKTQITELELGKRPPTVKTLAAILAALEVTWSEFGPVVDSEWELHDQGGASDG